MNINKFFQKAKEAGIEVSELNISTNTSNSIDVFRGVIENNTTSKLSAISARGIYNGKMGICITEKDNKDTIDDLINGIKSTATYIEREEEPIIFEGSPKYTKKNVYNKELAKVTPQQKIDLLFNIEKYIKEADSRVTDVQVSYKDQDSKHVLTNSYGLKLVNNTNYYGIVIEVVVRQGEETKVGFDVLLGNDFASIDYKAFAQSVLDLALNQLNGQNIKSGTYKAILSQDCVSQLLDVIIGHASSEDVQKGSSKYVGKLNEKLFSNKLTVTEAPLNKNVFFRYHDDEGVATYNKKIIDKGVLTTYLYNLETAKKDGVATTGNADRRGSKMGIGFGNLVIKPGKLSLEQLFEKIGNGIYVTDFHGLFAGLNSASGDFSVQAQGFRIENGKKVGPLGLFSVAGNVFDLFNEIIAIGGDAKLLTSSNTVPSIAFKKVKYSGV